ncbi:hypothetical protein BN1224_CV14_A_09110 [Chlamydia pneumoniae]|uniref:Uncharacterized protein n=1 Tax=Chlamydia pneumoniae TaxID=83558 RepID=A0A0F7XJJ6_CHLPN|nr:hypothetical protein BN1224_Wien1_A_09090 [Chlamydia pneumoniae]CRI36265.1 hypothetical protein BN1224_CM1_A_09120 [Chlamydia pneumoniae]CRI37392.1 hypothetical protein BN1224_CV14_A_09110 [Chlamydia pneumoniae]CRI38521.1 hypothetical protein BN1224_CV15_C_03540 [Chlamydia pneumoniae]CRI39653.1 hypothetical protein BN1224_CWL011_A_09170 [Chlamydia pneumoniae]
MHYFFREILALTAPSGAENGFLQKKKKIKSKRNALRKKCHFL